MDRNAFSIHAAQLAAAATAGHCTLPGPTQQNPSTPSDGEAHHPPTLSPLLDPMHKDTHGYPVMSCLHQPRFHPCVNICAMAPSTPPTSTAARSGRWVDPGRLTCKVKSLRNARLLHFAGNVASCKGGPPSSHNTRHTASHHPSTQISSPLLTPQPTSTASRSGRWAEPGRPTCSVSSLRNARLLPFAGPVSTSTLAAQNPPPPPLTTHPPTSTASRSGRWADPGRPTCSVSSLRHTSGSSPSRDSPANTYRVGMDRYVLECSRTPHVPQPLLQ
jgi:hypothetical protein